jgi:putative ABC transport system substrate-binding protein
MKRVGVLYPGAESGPEAEERLNAFRQALEKLGWVEGRNVRFDTRFAVSNADQFQPLARELIALRPDVVLTIGSVITAALARESRTIPIVFVLVSDPIGAGLVESQARPGGNVTGFLQVEDDIVGKWISMLKEIAPRVARVAMIANPKTANYEYFLRVAEAVAPRLAIEAVSSPIARVADDIGQVIAAFSSVPNGGLVVLPDSTAALYRDLIVALAARYRLPAIYYNRSFVTAGGLISYGFDFEDQYRQAAIYVDRILRGDKPAELPVQAPTKYQTVINLKTAKALGLTIPETLLATADEVIQ